MPNGSNKLKHTFQEILARADIVINGTRPWDMQAHDERLYERILTQGSLGLGESYMDGWWDARELDQFFDRVLTNKLDQQARVPLRMLLYIAGARLFNRQRVSASHHSIQYHYDRGNDVYRAMLDARMVYSSGYWKSAKNLDEAQEAKLDLVCRKLGLQPGMRLLDIGCGWGSLVQFVAERYGVEVVGITLSKEQVRYAREVTKGLPVEILLQDYRLLKGSFDRIASIGMFEHVGYRNYRKFMTTVHRCLKDGGLFLLHTIGGNTSAKNNDPWVHRYIFPNSMIPSIRQIGKAIEGLFVMDDWHTFGADYDRTLMAWFTNFDKHWPGLRSKYGDRFYRMWKYYLLSGAGSVRARRNQLWQIVLSKNGVRGGYQSVR